MNEIYVNCLYTGKSDGTRDKPFKTVAPALAAMTGAKGGYVLHIAPGVYMEKAAIETPVEGLIIYGNNSTLYANGGLTVNGLLTKCEVTIYGTVTVESGGSVEEILHSGLVVISEATPVNAIAAKSEMAAALTTLIAAGDTVTIGDSTFAMVASEPTATQFTDVAGLTALIHALAAYTAANDAGKITVTAAVKGLSGNGTVVTFAKTEDTTADGAEAVKAAATIAAASLAQMAAGDTVTFDGNTFTKVASNAGAGQFTDTAGLIVLLAALEGWAAVDDGSDIDITAAENGAAANDKDIVISYKRTTAGGINGTVGIKGEAHFDETHIYVCKANNTIADANWVSATLA